MRGYLSLRSSTAENREILSRILDRAVKTFPNIRSVALLPSSYYSELFSGVLETLSQSTQLQELSVNRSSLNDAYLAYLRKIVGLKALTIRDPLSAFTKLLSEGWLGRMSGSLVELHLEGICCAIPSHVLYAELANLKRIRTLSIGYLGAQSESSLFSALASLPDLRFLSLQYDEEIPENCYRLSLISLTIRYFGPQSQSDSSGLCSWVQAIMSSCPLEELHLIDDNGEAINGDMGRDENFHRFVQYIVLHHASTLRLLRMPNIFFGADTLECIYAKCNSLEELTFATSRNALLSVYPSHPNMRSLCALSVSLRDVDGNGDLRLSLADAGVIMGRIPSLRSLIANNSEWKVNRVSLDYLLNSYTPLSEFLGHIERFSLPSKDRRTNRNLIE
ncbi:hypothetical protein VNI00_007744 [Paramarasmius palmivorus]|uniref:Uncharacterized protein n=1 Tax=Paramarasmius palmivorus TaxID=297713 RepID=A0AAW0CZV2_9AGAR